MLHSNPHTSLPVKIYSTIFFSGTERSTSGSHSRSVSETANDVDGDSTYEQSVVDSDDDEIWDGVGKHKI